MPSKRKSYTRDNGVLMVEICRHDNAEEQFAQNMVVVLERE